MHASAREIKSNDENSLEYLANVMGFLLCIILAATIEKSRNVKFQLCIESNRDQQMTNKI